MDALDAPRKVLRITARLYQRISAQIILILAFLGLVYFLVYFLLNSTFASRVFDQLVNSEFRGRIAWGRLQWGPLPWQLSLSDVVMADSQDRPVITARRIRVDDLHLAELLRMRVAASRILIEDPVVRLVARAHPEGVDALGQPVPLMNISEMFLPPPGVVVLDEGAAPSELHLDFQDVDITNARFLLDLPDFFLEVRGADVEQARFYLNTLDAERSMTMGAARLGLQEGYVLVPRGPLVVPAVEAEPGDVMRFSFADGVARFFDWRFSAFTVAGFTTTSRGDPISVRALAMDLSGPSPTLRADVDIEAKAIQNHLEPLGISGIAGPATVRARGEGELDAYGAHAEVSGAGLDVMGHAVGAYRLVAVKDPDDRMVVESLTAEALAGRVELSADFDLPTGDAVAVVDLLAVDPSLLPEVAQDRAVASLAQGPLTARVRVHGASLLDDDRRISATLDLTHRRTGRELPGLARLAELDLIASLEGGQVVLHHLRADAGDNRVALRGALDLPTLQAQASGRVDVARLAELGAALGVPLVGAVSATFEAGGTVKSPSVGVKVVGTGLRYADYPAADVVTDLRYTGKAVQVGRLDVTTDVGSVSAAGKVALGRVPTFDLQVRLKELDLTAVPLALDISGQVDTPTPITITGPLSAPQIAGAVAVTRPRYGRLLLDGVTVAGAWAGKTATLDRLEVRGQGATWVEASGSIDLRRLAYTGTLDVRQVPLALADAFAPSPTGVAGRLTVHLEGEGTVAAPQAAGSIAIEQLAVGELKLADSLLTVQAEGDQVTLGGKLLGAFDIAAHTGLGPGQAGEATVSFQRIDPKVLLAIDDESWSAKASGEVKAAFRAFDGALDAVVVNISELGGSWRLYDAQGQIVQTPGLTCPTCPTLMAAAARPIRLSFRHGVITVDDFNIAVNRQIIGLAGTVGVDGTVDLAVGGRFDLALGRPFLQSVFTDVQGSAELQVGVIGPLTAPQATGWVRLERLELAPRSPVIANDLRLIQPVEFKIGLPDGVRTAEGDGAILVSIPRETRPTPDRPAAPNAFLLRRDESTVAIKRVEVLLEKFALERLAVAIDANDLVLNIPKVVRGQATLRDLTVELFQHRRRRRPPETRLKVGGEVEIQRLEYVADISPPGAINQEVADNIAGRTRARTVSAFERVPLLKRLMLDLHVFGKDEIYVRSDVAVATIDMELKMDVTARGFLVGTDDDAADEQLTLDGQVDILDDSRIVYQRRPFDVTSGQVNFGNSSNSNFMTAELIATHTFRLRTDEGGGASSFELGGGGDVREEEVTLKVSAAMSTRDSELRIKPELSSSGGASQIEVLTLLLTGRLPSDLTGAAGAQPATEALLGPVLNLIEQPLEETLDLDLSLTAATTGTLFVDVDKVLSRRLRLYSRTPVGNESATNPQTFGLEYRINNLATGELTTEQLGSNNATSGRLRLRLELD
ncbi:MAG: translocation/assembly module TamB domain-containing protein [Myxococcales bacterium]|nr:translocation/assembly module TamB domain-containing protein [Myxococcales bacterium]